MQSTPSTSWREQESLTVTEAARIAGRSRKWVYDAITSRRLETSDGEGPMRVTTASLAALLDRVREARLAAARDARPVRSHLRLVVDNT